MLEDDLSRFVENLKLTNHKIKLTNHKIKLTND